MGFVAGIGSWAAARQETNCEERMSQLARGDACSMVLATLGFLLKLMSMCWDCFVASLGNAFPSVDEESGMFELGLGWCSKSLPQGYSVLARSRKHELEDLGLCESFGWDGFVAPGSGG